MQTCKFKLKKGSTKRSEATFECNIKTAVCTHDSYTYNLAKDSNTLHLCWPAACCFLCSTASRFAFFVLHTLQLHALSSFNGKPEKAEPARRHRAGCYRSCVQHTGALAFLQRRHSAADDGSVFAFVFTSVSTQQKCVHLHRLFKREQACCAPVGSVQTKHLYSQYRKRSDINSIWVSVLEVNKVRRVSPWC